MKPIRRRSAGSSMGFLCRSAGSERPVHAVACRVTGGTIGVDVCLDECNGYYGTIPEDKYR